MNKIFFSESADKIGGLLFVDFYTDWCEPCKLLEPILDDVQKKVGDSVNIQKINIDKRKDLAKQYDIRSVPTLMLFREGELLWRMAGFDTADELVKIISTYCK